MSRHRSTLCTTRPRSPRSASTTRARTSCRRRPASRAFARTSTRTQKQVESSRQQVVAAMLTQSQGQAFSSATQVALSESPDAFLERLVVVSQYNDQQQEMKAEFAKQVRQLELRQETAKRELAGIQQHEAGAGHPEGQDRRQGQPGQGPSHPPEDQGCRAGRGARRGGVRSLERSRTPSPAPTPSTPAASPTPAPAPAPSASGRARGSGQLRPRAGRRRLRLGRDRAFCIRLFGSDPDGVVPGRGQPARTRRPRR